MIKKLNRQNLIYISISVAVNLLIAALAIFVFGVRYSSDDDLSMAYIAYGIYMKPSARIVFSNIVIGWLMKTMFALKSTINWQVVLYFAGLCASGFVSLLEVIKTKCIKLYFLWAIFVLCFFYCSFVSITFTVVAAYVCCQGYLAFFLSIKQKDIVCMVLSGFALVYASLIRFESVMGISMYAAVSWATVVFSFIKSEGNVNIKSIVQKYIRPFVIVVAGIAFFYAVDKVAYISSDWASYYKYNLLRGEVLDDCSVINMNDEKRQNELGISKAMADTLNEWYFNDPEVFNIELFSDIDRVSTELRGEYIDNPIRDMLLSIKDILGKKSMMRVSMMVLIILIIISALEKRKIKMICLSLSIIPFFIQVFSYCFMGRYSDALEKIFPPRLIEITIMGFFMCYILIQGSFEEGINNSPNNRLSVVMLGIALALTMFMQSGEKYQIRGFSLKSESMIEDKYSYLGDGNIYVMEFRALQTFMNEYRVWQNPPQGYLYNYIPLGGCEMNYPYLVEKQNELGACNPYKSLFENDNVYLVSDDKPDIELAYLRDMYDENIDYELVATHDTLNIYKFSNR